MQQIKSNIRPKSLNNKRLKIGILILLGFIIAIGCLCGYICSRKTTNKQDIALYIYPTDDCNKVKETLITNNVISSSNTTFTTFAKALKYTNNIKAGHYVIKPNTPIIKLIRNLRSGNQQPIKLVITNARTSDEFAEKVCKNLMITTDDLRKEIDNQKFNHNNELFEYIIPNTYEVYWTIGAEDLLKKLKKESDKFWKKHQKNLKHTGLSQKEVIILASIVEEETNKTDEKPIVAGVYINRLNKNMLLQADPTIKFALGDFSIRRVLGKYLQIESPFNTYKILGLPPAPICLPSVSSITSVLQYEHHNYIYFCAREDFSGYHNFAVTLNEHLQNAKRYHKALNKKNTMDVQSCK